MWMWMWRGRGMAEMERMRLFEDFGLMINMHIGDEVLDGDEQHLDRHTS